MPLPFVVGRCASHLPCRYQKRLSKSPQTFGVAVEFFIYKVQNLSSFRQSEINQNTAKEYVIRFLLSTNDLRDGVASYSVSLPYPFCPLFPLCVAVYHVIITGNNLAMARKKENKAMANVVKQFRNMSLDLDNQPMAGTVEEFHPPNLSVDTTPYKAGGMDVPVLLDMGMNVLMARAMVNGYQPKVFSQFGLADKRKANMTVYGALEDYTGEVTQVKFVMRGLQTTTGMERVRGRGEVPRTVIEIACVEYIISFDNTVMIDIDVLNMTRIVNGVDRLAKLRAAIGLNN